MSLIKINSSNRKRAALNQVLKAIGCSFFRLYSFTVLLTAVVAMCDTPLAVACTTTLVTAVGNIDSRLPVLPDRPPNVSAPVEEQVGAAQFSTISAVYDSLGNAHSFYFLMYHVSNSDAPWEPRVIFDGGEFAGGTPGKPSAIMFEPLALPTLDGSVGSAPVGIGFAPTWNNKSSVVSFVIQTDLRQSAAITKIDLVQDGRASGCEQYGTNDFDGDGKDDIAVWRPSIGFWAIKKSSTRNNDIIWKQWGLPGDLPMPGDYTGDSRADLVVWRSSEGNWYICRSDDNFDCSKGKVYQFGLPGDRPIKGDFDGDHILDYAVYRPSNNSLYYRKSSSGTGQGEIIVQQWGLPGDIPLFGGVDH
ncbi:hypothetical protein [Candidatus Contendibacter odensensis]|uniref:VCBS repeat-containing protein n=1 Tax=Candidatus Contendobacter odensis Run_B_J11 TaxID=1400861 RepID=A0A7U7J391_9GAMM|nr:hypothetical protein [Candidatus Contendobacter odensis]CDH44339.1 exported hypothetical protein [Candidatus Contendobacter odensis Run_B_J11]